MKALKFIKMLIIAAYAVIGANVEIGAGTVIDSHAVIEGPTKIGKNNHIYLFLLLLAVTLKILLIKMVKKVTL